MFLYWKVVLFRFNFGFKNTCFCFAFCSKNQSHFQKQYQDIDCIQASMFKVNSGKNILGKTFLNESLQKKCSPLEKMTLNYIMKKKWNIKQPTWSWQMLEKINHTIWRYYKDVDEDTFEDFFKIDYFRLVQFRLLLNSWEWTRTRIYLVS